MIDPDEDYDVVPGDVEPTFMNVSVSDLLDDDDFDESD